MAYDTVILARDEAAEEYHKFLNLLLSTCIDNKANRAKVLQPVLAQNEWTARYHKRRGTSPEVDSNTGDPIDGDAPTPPEDVVVTDGSEGADNPASDNVDTPVTLVVDPVLSE